MSSEADCDCNDCLWFRSTIANPNPGAPLLERIAKLEAEKDGAYQERDRLVAALSKLFPSTLGYHAGEWEDDWRNIVYVNLPTGQASWHIHDSELPLFKHLRADTTEWDGHTTEEKYARLAALAQDTEAVDSRE